MFRRKISDPIFGSEFTVLIGTHEELDRFLVRLGERAPADRRSRAKTIEWISDSDESNRLYFLWLFSGQDRWNINAAVVHELIHLAALVFPFRGIEFNTHTEETYAYYVEWAWRSVQNAIDAYEDERKRKRSRR